MPPEQAQLQPYLAPDERVLWIGRPVQGLAFHALDIFVVPFSLVWACGVVTMFVARRPHMPEMAVPFSAFEALFLTMAFYITIGRFLIDGWLRAHIVYGVTSNRVIIVSNGLWTSVTSYDRGPIPGLRLQESSNGRGSILFKDDHPYSRGGLSLSGAASSLFRITDAKHVFDLIRSPQGRAVVSPDSAKTGRAV